MDGNKVIEFLLDSMDLIRVILGIFSGFFAGVWFSMSIQKCTGGPYRIVEELKHYNWPTPKSYRDVYGNPGDEHSS